VNETPLSKTSYSQINVQNIVSKYVLSTFLVFKTSSLHILELTFLYFCRISPYLDTK